MLVMVDSITMTSSAATVEEYLAELPPDRREVIAAVRAVILANLDPAYQEKMAYGMIGYSIPHSVYPAGYHCNPKDPLPFAGLASQKNNMAVYLMSLYIRADGADTAWFESEWAKSGKKLDKGKSCIRFKKLTDLDLNVLAQAIKRVPAKLYIEYYEARLASAKKPKR